MKTIIERLEDGNRRYTSSEKGALRMKLAAEGQHPYAVVVCCSDSRVIPEEIFGASLGELFVIRVAGNVLDRHQIGSIEYATSHLGCKLVIMLGHTRCGAVGAALEGHAEGYVGSIVDDIRKAIGDEKDPDKASCLNVLYGVEILKREIKEAEIRGALYDIKTGAVRWL
ncbi:MAG: hypothetical protein IKP61_07195 [Spirochaetales bacterium]|nr:hypothetical protein [Spirochaetales bacterium]